MKQTKKPRKDTKATLLMYIYVSLITIGFVSFIFILVTPKSQTIVEYLYENNIKLLKTEGCGWCQKQLAEFSQEELWDMQDSSILIECNQNGTWICGEVGTPAWWQGTDEPGVGTIIHEGYLQRGDIIKVLEDSP